MSTPALGTLDELPKLYRDTLSKANLVPLWPQVITPLDLASSRRLPLFRDSIIPPAPAFPSSASPRYPTIVAVMVFFVVELA